VLKNTRSAFNAADRRLPKVAAHLIATSILPLASGAKNERTQEEDQLEEAGGGILTPAAQLVLAEKAPLEELLWFYHELASPETEKVIAKRLREGEQIAASARASYGKLMERLLYFREKKLPSLMIYCLTLSHG